MECQALPQRCAATASDKVQVSREDAHIDGSQVFWQQSTVVIAFESKDGID